MFAKSWAFPAAPEEVIIRFCNSPLSQNVGFQKVVFIPAHVEIAHVFVNVKQAGTPRGKRQRAPGSPGTGSEPRGKNFVWAPLSVVPQNLVMSKKGHSVRQWRTQDLAKGGLTGGLGVKPPAAYNLLRFSHEKTLILANLFIEKGHAVRAVTVDNAKTFSQLTSKSRSLTKISERRLQPLLV